VVDARARVAEGRARVIRAVDRPPRHREGGS
jgi:hypothetical protein